MTLPQGQLGGRRPLSPAASNDATRWQACKFLSGSVVYSPRGWRQEVGCQRHIRQFGDFIIPLLFPFCKKKKKKISNILSWGFEKVAFASHKSSHSATPPLFPWEHHDENKDLGESLFFFLISFQLQFSQIPSIFASSRNLTA